MLFISASRVYFSQSLPSPDEDLLHRGRGLDRNSTVRRHHVLYVTQRVYTTKPGGSLFLPQLATPTRALHLPTGGPANSSKILKMRRRHRTCTAERTQRIEWELGLNHARIQPTHHRSKSR
jgi:hypothetical protein